jgi:hypothetical protein
MLDSATVAKLNLAVSQCVDTACSSDKPLSTLLQSLDALRQRSDWTSDEVDEVERSVLDILRKLAAR